LKAWILTILEGICANLNDKSSRENAIDKKCAREIARHK
jgi:hypothetical protein